MFTINGLHKLAEVDNYEDGCIRPAHEVFIDVSFTAASIDEVIAKAQSFVGVNDEGTERNACDEVGRVDFCRAENAEGYEPSPAEIEQWKAGKLQLWYATYTGYLYQSLPIAA